jgi:hypothetical protein
VDLTAHRGKFLVHRAALPHHLCQCLQHRERTGIQPKRLRRKRDLRNPQIKNPVIGDRPVQ